MKNLMFFLLVIVFAFAGCSNSSKKADADNDAAGDESTDVDEVADDTGDEAADSIDEIAESDESSDSDESDSFFETVSIESGTVKGVVKEGVVTFKGIPYAEPPVGELRWIAPVEKAAWEGTLEAKAYSKACPQSVAVGSGQVLDWSEDCLYLNVFRPDDTKKDMPVMVFIHGGGYVNGASSLETYEASWLSTQGVIIVTINYRLGQLGFVAIPDTEIKGNYGNPYQIAALEWVKKNIKAFGGDPENVTIFGESAGAMSVGTMIALRPDLFKRAIIESGTIAWGDAMKKADADDQGTRFVEAAGCKDAEDVEKCLRDKTPEEILTYLESGILSNQAESYGPHVDGTLFTDVPYKMAVAGDGKNIPLIIGTNLDEGTVFTYSYKSYLQTEDQYKNVVTTQFGAAFAPTVLAEYPISDYTSPWNAYTDLFADLYFNCSSILMARDFAKFNKNIRYYRFSHVPDYGATYGLGCFHGAELGYLFNTWYDIYKNTEAGYDETVENITGLWIKFATDGELPDWPVYDADENYLDISSELEVKTELEKKNCDFWSTYFPI